MEQMLPCHGGADANAVNQYDTGMFVMNHTCGITIVPFLIADKTWQREMVTHIQENLDKKHRKIRPPVRISILARLNGSCGFVDPGSVRHQHDVTRLML